MTGVFFSLNTLYLSLSAVFLELWKLFCESIAFYTDASSYASLLKNMKTTKLEFKDFSQTCFPA